MGRPSSKLRGKVAVVTGSTRGIGLMIAASFAQAGAQIAICGRKMASVEAVYNQLTAIPGVQVLGAECDMRDLDAVKTLAEQTIDRFGKIDVWVNNAGITGAYAQAGDIPADAWADVIHTNLIGTFHGTQVALKHMLPRNEGKIINLIGAGAREKGRLPTYMSAYGSSKAAILRFTQITAEEYQHTNLSILAMSPGFVRTDLMKLTPLTPEAEAAYQKLDDALERFGTELVEAGELAVRLASRETDGVTGKIYEVKPSMGKVLKGILGRG